MPSHLQVRQSLAHEAMATTFTATIVHEEPRYARQAAAAAFAELDRIEGRLSRFTQTSDVSRINRLATGRSTPVQLDTFDCLRIALAVQHETGGAFDAAYGSAGPARGPRFELCEAGHTVHVLANGVRLDLGGIGKGFALDRMAALLAEWEIQSALLCASTSTVLALGAPPGEARWRASIGPDHDRRSLCLARRALSGSGRTVQGSHIVDPRTGRAADRYLSTWATAPTAAVADALSTALMVMSEDEIRRYGRRHPDVSAYVQKSATTGLVTLAGPRET